MTVRKLTAEADSVLTLPWLCSMSTRLKLMMCACSSATMVRGREKQEWWARICGLQMTDTLPWWAHYVCTGNVYVCKWTTVASPLTLFSTRALGTWVHTCRVRVTSDGSCCLWYLLDTSTTTNTAGEGAI